MSLTRNQHEAVQRAKNDAADAMRSAERLEELLEDAEEQIEELQKRLSEMTAERDAAIARAEGK